MMELGWLVFLGGLCCGTWIGTSIGLVWRRTDRAPAPPACPFDDVPPAPPNLRLVQRAKPFDWQRDGAA